MNKIVIIGNLTRDPELKSINTKGGEVNLCEFTVAVNNRRKGSNEQQDATFFRVTAWRGLGENCAKYLTKGKKVMVEGQVSARAYLSKTGEAQCSIEIAAEDIEFLSSAGGDSNSYSANRSNTPAAAESNMAEPVQTDELPF